MAPPTRFAAISASVMRRRVTCASSPPLPTVQWWQAPSRMAAHDGPRASGARDRAGAQLARRAAGLQALGLGGLEALGVELLARRLGDEHLTGLGALGHARGDVDVDAEEV